MNQHRTFTAAIALGIAVAASLMVSALVSAHAPITSVMWDSATAPTKVIASSGQNGIDPTAGTFYLRVYDATGQRVDLDNAAVGTPRNTISVSVQSGLAAGTYRVDWRTKSDDGESLDGSIELVLGGGAAMATAEAGHEHGATATATDGHAHDDMTMGGEHEMAPSCDVGDHPVSWVLEDFSGANIVPEPTDSPVYASLKLTFDPATDELTYALSIHGVSANQMTGAHVHRGGPDETSHDHAFDFFNGQQLTANGTTKLAMEDVERLCTGDLYVNLHTVDYPKGAARGQLQLPAHAHQDGGTITPPSTGDAGLASTGGHNTWVQVSLIAGLALVTLIAGHARFAGKRA